MINETRPPYYPVQLDLRDRLVLILGDSPDLRDRAPALINAGARVTLLVENPNQEQKAWATANGVKILAKAAPSEDEILESALIYVNRKDARTEALHRMAVEKGKLVCAPDLPARSTFIHPSIASVSGLVFTVSSSGKSPALVRRIKEDLIVLFEDSRFGRFLQELAKIRSALPNEERSVAMKTKLAGFKVNGHIIYPAWFKDE